MARTLEELQKQYSSKSHSQQKGPMGGGPRGGGARGMSGKPKNTKGTVLRLLSYLKPYKIHLVFVILFMIINTLTSLLGSYMLRPIINHVAGEENAKADFADKIISAFCDTFTPFANAVTGSERASEIMIYLITGLCILACIYLIGILTSFCQSKIMVHVSRGAIESI